MVVLHVGRVVVRVRAALLLHKMLVLHELHVLVTHLHLVRRLGLLLLLLLLLLEAVLFHKIELLLIDELAVRHRIMEPLRLPGLLPHHLRRRVWGDVCIVGDRHEAGIAHTHSAHNLGRPMRCDIITSGLLEPA